MNAQVHGENDKSSRIVNENGDKSGDNSRRWVDYSTV